jgi:2-polyprenyl-3-methyl-5-hydroxy-6-metoxy-1,4-benzoquinol methylase
MTPPSRDAAHFERLYAANPDPWGFTTSVYEQEKYARSLAAVADRRYGSALEVGCSIGVLSRQVAPLCDRFLGVDITDMPLDAARRRCGDLPQARFVRMAIPAEWPQGPLDLVVLSEVLYFLDGADISGVATRLREHLQPGGRVLLVNWTGALDDPNQGIAAADRCIAETGFPIALRQMGEGYRLDLLQRD